MKKCSSCQQDRPFEDFAKRTKSKTGYAAYCKDCHRAYYKAWKASNPGKVRKNAILYYERHRAVLLKKGAQWRGANRERHAELIKDWGKRHPEKRAETYKKYRETHAGQFKAWQNARRDSGRRRISNWIRRTAERAGTVSQYHLTQDLLFGRFELYGWRCRYCGTPLTKATVQADHRIPISRGGQNCPANIVPTCGPCNRKKWAKTEAEFLSEGT